MHQRFDRPKHHQPDVLDCAREDVRSKVGLILVDADAPAAVPAGRLEAADAAVPGDAEHHARTLCELPVGNPPTHFRVAEVVGDAVEQADGSTRPACARPEAGDEPPDGTEVEGGDAAGRVGTRAPTLDAPGQVADHIADLLFAGR